MPVNKYDRQRPIYDHRQGKALKYGQAWLDHYIEFGTQPNFKQLYLEIVAKEGTLDKYDIEDMDEKEIGADAKVIDALNSAYTFIKRYSIREWFKEQKVKELTTRSSLVKDDYIGILNAMIMNNDVPNADRLKALQQVTKMLGIEGASKIEQSGGFRLNMDWKKED